MRGRSKKTMTAILAALGLIAVAVPAFAQQDDPLVSLSYLNQRLAALEKNITQESPKEQAPAGNVENVLEVVELAHNQRLIVAQGSEMILRSGEASVIASSLGGLSDVTGGTDLSHGKAAPKNHMLIAPRSDGRGLSATRDSIVLVRGSYRIADGE